MQSSRCRRRKNRFLNHFRYNYDISVKRLHHAERIITIHDRSTSLFSVIIEKLSFLFFNKYPISVGVVHNLIDPCGADLNADDAQNVTQIFKRNYELYFLN